MRPLRPMRTLLYITASVLTAITASALAGVLIGGSANRRRARMRDRLSHDAHVVRRRSSAARRYVGGRFAGAAHAVAVATHLTHLQAPPDTNAFLKQRVESELGHDQDLPLAALNLDVVDAVVHVRGTIPDVETARRLLRRVAAVDGVRGVVSMMRTQEGTPVLATADEPGTVPRVFALGDAVLARLTARWPQFTEFDVLDSDGHPERLAQLIAQHTGEPEDRVRQELDQILLAAI
jgi:BON domain